MAATHRTIVESELFALQKTGLGLSCERLDEIIDGTMWVLCRKPDFFPLIPGTLLYGAVSETYPGVETFVIWFTFDADEVCLQSIEHLPPEY